MIDDRYSADSFECAGHGSQEARTLSKQLRDEIQIELDQVIRPAVLQTIARLNSMGHKLVPAEQLKPGDMRFVEPDRSNPATNKFVVAFDLVLSVGYPQTIDQYPD